MAIHMPDNGASPSAQARRSVLVCDSDSVRRHAAMEALVPLNHRILQAANTGQALNTLGKTKVDLIVADMRIPDLGGGGLCRRVRTPEASAQLPVVLMVNSGYIDDEVQALEAGADMVLLHGAHPRALRASIDNCIRRSFSDLDHDDTETVLFALARSVEERDPALGHHCERLALMASAIGAALGLDPESIVALQRGGYLHDIGKVAIPDSVLFKPGPLTPEEWEIMKSHTERGARICQSVRSLRSVLPIIRHHHERWDGGGYPDGLKGEHIPLLARIVQIVDIYDALTTARPYKRAFPPADAIAILREETAKGWRDPGLVDTFCRLLPLFQSPNTDWAQLSLQSLAAALARYPKESLQPPRNLALEPANTGSPL